MGEVVSLVLMVGTNNLENDGTIRISWRSMRGRGEIELLILFKI